MVVQPVQGTILDRLQLWFNSIQQASGLAARLNLSTQFVVTYDAVNNFFNITIARTRGKTTFSGDGATLTFNIPHTLGSTPVSIHVNPGSANAVATTPFYTADGVNITVNYATAPVTGTNNLVYWWVAFA